MNNRETILKEIESVAATTVRVGTILPFTIPANYFEDLPATILAFIQENEVVNLPKTVALYAVPDDYFNNFSNSILAKINTRF